MMDNPVIFSIGPIDVTMVVVATWCMMAVVFIGALILRLRLRAENPGGAQTMVEMLLDWLGDEIEQIVNRDARPFIPLVGSLFIFVLVSNLTSLVSSLIPGYRPPTADITTTAALATAVFFAVPFYGIVMSGPLRYLKTYVEPTWVMLPMNLVSEFSRTLALAIRLFGNIFSGEVLFMVVLGLVPFFLPLAFMFLSLVTGTIQAYIFAILATVYIGGAVKKREKQLKEDVA